MTKVEFKEIYDQYFNPVRSFIYYRCGDSDFSTDIAQEVFLNLWSKRDKIDLKMVKGLLFKMAKDKFISQVRRKTLEMNYRDTLEIEPYTNSNDDSESVEYKELQNQYDKGLSELSEKQREVFLMSRIEKLKYHEIAERLEISVKAVEKRMKLALLHLKTLLNYP